MATRATPDSPFALSSSKRSCGHYFAEPFDQAQGERRGEGRKKEEREKEEGKTGANAPLLFFPFALSSSKRSCRHYFKEPFDEGPNGKNRESFCVSPQVNFSGETFSPSGIASLVIYDDHSKIPSCGRRT
jgi:hypothetical protein